MPQLSGLLLCEPDYLRVSELVMFGARSHLFKRYYVVAASIAAASVAVEEVLM